LALASVLSFAAHAFAGDGAEPDTNVVASTATDTNAQETLRTYLQLQEQLHLTQLAIEQNRREARETAAQNSEALAGRLQTIEKALEAQRSRELEEMQSSNRAMLVVAGTFAGIGFLAMFLMSFFQWRTVNRLAEISASLPASLALSPGNTRSGFGGDGQVVALGAAEQSSGRLLGTLEQLEKRIYQLEHTNPSALSEGEQAHNGGNSADHLQVSGGEIHEGGGKANGNSAEADRINVLLGKGQSMLNLDDAQAAVSCFDEVLNIEPNNAEAWVRKGTALEKLQQLKEAVECYDHALAVDSSMTIAYLHKGGLFNRMERFNDALECYEKALRTQENRRA
jgi:hypothetical protein